ncbi:hypothetical protein [Mangrovibacterium sp.]|uniref:hypothetical protein n=1 Tax=Mangrovibacterium sp. TaxID=1961364 RepID=UPI00356159EF
MANVLYVDKKIGDTYLVWLQNSNLYFQLEEPAWYVFKKLATNNPLETVAEEFATQYGVAHEESKTFVSDIYDRISEANIPFQSEDETALFTDDIVNSKFQPYSVFHYQLNTTVVRFTYETAWLERYIHPLIAHLAIAENKKPEFHFELFTSNGQVVYRLNNNLRCIWDRDKSNYTKGQIFIDLVNLIHQKTEDDWLMTVHASAITNEKKTILFSAPPGSGKTTIAALLQASGYHLISDDFVPFDKNSQNAYPFPIAMSVKEGSLELLSSHFPALKDLPLHHITSEKKVRYLPIGNDKMKMVYPVHEIIFINYDSSIDFEWEKLDPFVAFKLLLEQIWVEPNLENVQLLLDKVSTFDYYKLTYSNSDKALNAIEKLFQNE